MITVSKSSIVIAKWHWECKVSRYYDAGVARFRWLGYTKAAAALGYYWLKRVVALNAIKLAFWWQGSVLEEKEKIGWKW